MAESVFFLSLETAQNQIVFCGRFEVNSGGDFGVAALHEANH